MKPKLEQGISSQPNASFRAFRLYQPAFESQWHYHPELEIVFFTKGRGMKFIGDNVSFYTEGDLFLLGENLPHTFVTHQEESTPLVEAFCVQFSKKIFENFIECKSFIQLFEKAKKGISFSQTNDVIVEKIKALTETDGITSLILLIELIEALTQIADQESVVSPDYQAYELLSEGSTRLRIAIDYVNTHYPQDIALSQIAEVCSLSPNAFCRWFKQKMGITFIDYLNKVRLSHVCQLLISTDLSVGQIALQAGFENISTLNRLFQQKLQTTPSGYRNQQK
jgi:AraC-like DNA-binding protein